MKPHGDDTGMVMLDPEDVARLPTSHRARLQVASSLRAFCEALERTENPSVSGRVPVLLSWAHWGQRLAAALDAPVRDRSLTVNTVEPAVSPKAHRGHVVSVDRRTDSVASAYATFRRCSYRRGSLRRFPDPPGESSPVTVVGLAESFEAEQLEYLRASLGHRPWGILTARTVDELCWQMTKAALIDSTPRFGRLLLLPLEPEAIKAEIRSDTEIATATQISRATLSSLTTRMRDLVAVTSHGDEADVYVGYGHICSRKRVDLEGGATTDRPMRCQCEADCYRQTASEMLDGIPAARKVLVPGEGVLTKAMLLNSCAGVLLGNRGRYTSEMSLVLTALSGLTTAVIATDGLRRYHVDEALVFAELTASGFSIGEATLYLNSLQDGYFGGQPPFIVLGDPTVRLAPPTRRPRALDGTWDNDGRVVEVELPHRTSLHRLGPRLADHVKRFSGVLSVELVPLSEAPIRPYLLRSPTASYLLTLADGRKPKRQRLVISPKDASRDGATDTALRALQRRSQCLAAFGLDAGERDTGSLLGIIADLRHALRLGVLVGGRDQLIRALEDHLVEETAYVETRAIAALLRRWSNAIGGEISSRPNSGLLVGEPKKSSLLCPHCSMRLWTWTVNHDRILEYARADYSCPRCTLVLDLPVDQGPPDVTAPAVLRVGHEAMVVTQIRNVANLPSAASVGVTILGARGKVSKAIAAGRVDPGCSIELSTRVLPAQGLVPGVYYLKVVTAHSMAFSFWLKPVTVIP